MALVLSGQGAPILTAEMLGQPTSWGRNQEERQVPDVFTELPNVASFAISVVPFAPCDLCPV